MQRVCSVRDRQAVPSEKFEPHESRKENIYSYKKKLRNIISSQKQKLFLFLGPVREVCREYKGR